MGQRSSVFLPLSRRSIHDDVDPENLHGIEWVRETQHGGEGYKA